LVPSALPLPPPGLPLGLPLLRRLLPGPLRRSVPSASSSSSSHLLPGLRLPHRRVPDGSAGLEVLLVPPAAVEA
jgi:hypothetical protein